MIPKYRLPLFMLATMISGITYIPSIAKVSATDNVALANRVLSDSGLRPLIINDHKLEIVLAVNSCFDLLHSR